MRINANVVDLFHGDQVADLSLAKTAGIRGVIHKAHQGSSSDGYDPLYRMRKRQAIANGLLWGAYHFMTNDDPTDQATSFLQSAFPDGIIDKTTLLAVDFEPYGKHTPTLAQLRTILDAIETRVERKAVIYSGNLIKEALGAANDPFFAGHRLWLAEYANEWKLDPLTAWKKPWLWQFTGDGLGPQPHRIPGIPGSAGNVDLNFFDGPDDELAQQWAS